MGLATRASHASSKQSPPVRQRTLDRACVPRSAGRRTGSSVRAVAHPGDEARRMRGGTSRGLERDGGIVVTEITGSDAATTAVRAQTVAAAPADVLRSPPVSITSAPRPSWLTTAGSRLVRWRAPGGWLLRGLFETGPVPAIVLIVAELGIVTPLTFALAGSASAIFHAYYLPIILAANRFLWRGAIATALVAGLFSGPLRPVNDAAGPAQQTWAWALRAAAFLLIGLLVAWLSRRSATSIVTVIRERGNARALRDALLRGHLHADYQPIVDLTTDAVIGFEALCRWTHAVDGPIPPSDFIPLAERTGVVVPLGRYMLSQAAHQVAAWHAAGATHLVVAVNVSAEQLSRTDLLYDVTAVLRATKLPAQALCLEITETAIIREPVAAMVNVKAAHDLGVLVALDDFGTGNSSLAYLKDFPIDIIKIDKSFIDDVDKDPRASALVLAIIELAHALGATTVAEGIERPSQRESLRLLGCDKGQGYLLGRPAPAEDVVLT
jgi:EAL domain-containing protein (putative c-di-GMP-specific phosphodiesterase class I)